MSERLPTAPSHAPGERNGLMADLSGPCQCAREPLPRDPANTRERAVLSCRALRLREGMGLAHGPTASGPNLSPGLCLSSMLFPPAALLLLRILRPRQSPTQAEGGPQARRKLRSLPQWPS